MSAARTRLIAASVQIAANKGEPPASKLVALRKLFIQERRDWSQRLAPRVGWKRGELFEVAEAVMHKDAESLTAEWGDVGYYLAQSFNWL